MAGWPIVTPGPRLSRLWWITGPLLMGLLGATILVGSRSVPYVVLSPGSARSVEPLVEVSQIEGGPEVTVDEAQDDLLFLTVTATVEPPGFFAAWAWLDDTFQVEPSAPYLGTQSKDENRALSLERMTDSQDKARKVALERLGFEVGTEAVGAFLEDVDPSYPSAEVLSPGMTVVGIEGEPVTDVDGLVAGITAKRPGDTLTLEVVPLAGGDPVEVSTELGRRTDDPSVAALGVSPVDRVTYEFPVDIAIDSGQVGGPSAGLAFTLAILDRMTPGDLTGPDRVALTGTIELDGSVGPVGGVRHKLNAAVDEGAQLFLVPPEEYDEAVEASRDRVEVVSVATLDEALAALEANGGDPLPDPGS